jgi:hypothetical protein
MCKWFKIGPKRFIRQYITQHMGGSCARAQIISHEIKPIERVNLQLALEQWQQKEKESAEVLGYAHRDFVVRDGLAVLQRRRWTVVAPVEREQLLRAPGVETAAERGETSSPLRLHEWDMERALAELIYFGGDLTQKLLGYRTFGFKPREPHV